LTAAEVDVSVVLPVEDDWVLLTNLGRKTEQIIHNPQMIINDIAHHVKVKSPVGVYPKITSLTPNATKQMKIIRILTRVSSTELEIPQVE